MVVTAVPDLQAPGSTLQAENIQQIVHHPPQGSDGGESEYESADEEELGEEEEEEEEELLILPEGVGLGEDNKPLDDDEDRKNPQYIPKKGTFYEHDDRTAAEEDVEKPPEEPVVKKEIGKKKVWKEDNKWNHDKFNEFDQAPKSRDELVAVYGYDIRNEEGPPRARRRRRYGRGPNKYTRNWEDLDAYAKPVRGGTLRGGPAGRGGSRSLTGSRKVLYNNEEFPALNSPQQHQKHPSDEMLDDHSTIEPQSPRHETPRSLVDDHLIIDNESPKQQQHSPAPYQHHQQNRNSMMSPQLQDVRADNHGGRGRGGRGRGRGSGRGANRDQHRYNDDRGMNNYDNYSGGRGGRGGYQQKGPPQHQSHLDDITLDMKNMNVNSQNRDDRHKKNRGGGNVENRRNNIPPRLQESAAAAANLHGKGNRGSNSSPGGDGSASSRPKRYSSQRQRSITDQPVPPFQQQQGFIDPSLEAGYQGRVFEGGVNPATSHTVTAPPSQLPIAGGAPPSFVPPAFTSPPTFPPEPFLGRPPAPRMFPPVTQSPHLFAGGPLGAPPVGAPPVPPGPPVTGPPFIPHEINYAAHPGPQPGPHTGPLPGAAPLAGPHPPQFPPFQGFTPGPVSQPGEIYSNGVTYYNTESQHLLPRNNITLQKRPKAAIPIVPPPERERRQDGSFSQLDDNQDDQQYVDSTSVLEPFPSELPENTPPTSDSPLSEDQQGESIIYQDTPEDQQGESTIYQDTPEDQQGESTIYQDTPEDQQGESTIYQDTHEDQQGESIKYHDTPEDQQGESIKYHDTPEDQQGESIKYHDTPENQQGESIIYHDTPADQQGESIVHHDMPEDQRVESIAQHDTSSDQQAESTAQHDMPGNQQVESITPHDMAEDQQVESVTRCDAPEDQQVESSVHHDTHEDDGKSQDVPSVEDKPQVDAVQSTVCEPVDLPQKDLEKTSVDTTLKAEVQLPSEGQPSSTVVTEKVDTAVEAS